MVLKRPISVKIFSIALGLLLLMTMVTLLSDWNLRKVNNEVLALSEYYIPLTARVTNIEVQVREQIIHLERLIQLQQLTPVDARALKLERSRFDEKGSSIEEEVKASILMVEQAQSSATIAVDLDKFAELRPELTDIITAHQHLHNTVLQFVTETTRGDAQSISLVHETIIEERTRVDKEIQDVRRELQKFTRSSAEKVATLERQAIHLNWAITVIACLLGLVFAAVITQNLVRPVRRLLQGTRDVEQGNLNVQIQATSADEIALLTESFNHMVTELKQKELIKETFGKYVDPRIVRNLLEDKHFAQGGEKRCMTVFFSDLAGFTEICERLTPDGVVRLLNQYFAVMSEPIREFGGVIDKYIGDAIMAFWGPPFVNEADHPIQACLAALEQFSRLDQVRQMLPEIMGLRKGLPTINVRAGLATGNVTVGNIGSEYSKGYTVIGDTVNLASRLETANKQYGTYLLISEDTWRMAKESIETRELDSIRVVGKSESLRVFELLARKGQLAHTAAEARDHFEAGLQFYRKQEWDQAGMCFEACLKLCPTDAPANVFLSRLKYFRDSPPGGDWDGVWSLSEK